MENYLEIIPDTTVREEKKILLGFRVHCDDDSDVIEWYINHFHLWLEFANITILASSCGIHRNTASHHFHYNLVASTHKIYKRPLKALTYAFETGKIQLHYPNRNTDHLPKSFHLNKHKKQCNLSLQCTPLDETESPARWLQYPLKEGLGIEEYFSNPYGLDYTQLTLNAKAEYAAVMEKKKKEEAKEQAASDSWKFMVDYLDKLAPDSTEKVLRHVLLHFKDLEEKPPTIRYMVDMAERYSFKRGILSLDTIIHKSMNRFI
ncbi:MULTISPECIES: hypothetical protein [Pseudomonadota]|uniref:hypothetical protein n=1 Tax=Rheinheimera sp. TaxID=1869214 RepID=UPI004048E3E7